ncbi:MAG: hypothetical protein IKJ04_08180 [Clostridia bacterium]|nr:hypothetical protein [Clostridia bacterium]MBR4034772.1 hypothetical protein [Clostridia bacterium]
MSSITYGITEEIYSLNGKSRRAYGIAAYADAEQDGTATIIAAVRDVTADKQRLAALVQKCNLLEVSPIHLDDVIEDFLTE